MICFVSRIENEIINNQTVGSGAGPIVERSVNHFDGGRGDPGSNSGRGWRTCWLPHVVLIFGTYGTLLQCSMQ